MLRTHTAQQLAVAYVRAKSLLIQMGYANEISWQEQRRLSHIGETEFLRESAWVVLSSGMRETVIRSKFDVISRIFFNWTSSAIIVKNGTECLARSLQVFNHRGKIRAILNICQRVHQQGFVEVKRMLLSQGVDYIRTMPYMGPVTSYHLAKNLGIDVVKPDRHLSRISERAGYSDPSDMCRQISQHVGDRLSVIDIVLWRSATLFPHDPLLLGSSRREGTMKAKINTHD